MPTILGIDIETYSSSPLPKVGVYRYADAPDFEILLFSYAFGDEPVKTIDLASGEWVPQDILAALEDPDIIKTAYNAQFERVCLSKHLGHLLDPSQWRCTAVMAAYLTLPARLADAAVALNLTQRKMTEGKDLIRYFSMPCKPTKTNGGRVRNLPTHAPDKWVQYKAYNAQDVETERSLRKALESYPLPEHEWRLYALDQRINDRGVRIDRLLVKNAMRCDEVFSRQAFQRAQELTGLSNPGSVSQLKAWLADQDMPMDSLAKKIVQEKVKDTDGSVGELLNLRLELSKTSVKKYEAMARTVCRDGRIHGLLQFGGASRTFRWAGRLVNVQNLPQNHLPDLSLATHDKKLLIAFGHSRRASKWHNREILWSEFIDKLAATTRTRESAQEYAVMTKTERDNIKDVGGFVGGYLRNGKRSNASVVNRCLICLDMDKADPGVYDDLDTLFINAYALYSTHSHTPEKMRLRLIVPLTRTVMPDEYAAISRRIAADLTLSRFDTTTFEPARLMYWPSTRYDIREIAFDRWGAIQMTQNLEDAGFTVVPFGQGFRDMSPPTKELMKLTLEQNLAHSGHPVLRWMIDNIFIRTDPAGNIKPDKEKSTEKIDGAIATIMALDRAVRHKGTQSESVYDHRGLIVF